MGLSKVKFQCNSNMSYHVCLIKNRLALITFTKFPFFLFLFFFCCCLKDKIRRMILPIYINILPIICLWLGSYELIALFFPQICSQMKFFQSFNLILFWLTNCSLRRGSNLNTAQWLKKYGPWNQRKEKPFNFNEQHKIFSN